MQYLLAKMTLASARHLSQSVSHPSTTSDSSDSGGLIRKHLDTCWRELLIEFGMCSDSEVFQVAFDMIATTKRERGVMTIVEADLLRNFFRNMAK